MKITKKRQWVSEHPIIFSLGLAWLAFIASGIVMTVLYIILTLGVLL